MLQEANAGQRTLDEHALFLSLGQFWMGLSLVVVFGERTVKIDAKYDSLVL